jgi:hypothetical protein
MGFQDAPSFSDADLARARTALGCRLGLSATCLGLFPGFAGHREAFRAVWFVTIRTRHTDALARHGSRRPAGAGCPREPAQRATVAAATGSRGR